MLKLSFCEVFVKYIAAHLRVLIGMELVKSYGYSQFRAAKEVDVAQPLLNYFLSGKRRSPYLESLRNNRRVMEIVRSVAARLARGEEVSMCDVCQEMKRQGLFDLIVGNVDMCRKGCDILLTHLG